MERAADTPSWVRLGAILAAGLALLAAAWLGWDAFFAGKKVSPRFNLLLITADTTRQDALGPYGGPASTPALDALAADGVVFEQAFTVATGTTPSHASLFSSLHPQGHGVYDNATALASDHQVLAEVLQAAGYRTAAFVSARPVARELGFQQGFKVYNDTFSWDPSLGLYSEHERRAHRTVDLCLEWLNEHGDGPFFIWVHLFDPHQPYCPEPPPADGSGLERFFVDSKGNPAYLKADQILATEPELIERLDAVAQSRYRQEIAAMDRAIGTLVAELSVRRLYDRTMVVFVSDHGENFLDDGTDSLFNHGGLGAAVTRLALILKLPRNEREGTRQRCLVGNLDLAPTILQVLGLRVPQSWSGLSFFAGLNDGASAAGRGHLVIESAQRALVSVRTDRWAYVAPRQRAGPIAEDQPPLPADEEIGLFDLSSDPKETRNRSGDIPEVIAAMRSLVSHFEAGGQGASGVTVTDAEHVAALEALGYVSDGP